MMKPIKFDPYVKRTIWGSETWTLSAVAGRESVSSFGTLPELIAREKGALVGKKVYAKFGESFPLLVKFIDARDDLSVQVHPHKTEMWYIVRADKNAKIYAGLKTKLEPSEITPKLMDSLAVYASAPGDAFYLPSGRVHAIGAGNYLAEIQETSDITYRIYDYDRKGPDGRPRELHLDLAREVINYSDVNEAYQKYDRANETAEVVSSPCFRVNRVVVAGERTADLKTEAFVIAVCLDGAAEINGVGIAAGETLLVPAANNILRLFGDATVLTATLDV